MLLLKNSCVTKYVYGTSPVKLYAIFITGVMLSCNKLSNANYSNKEYNKVLDSTNHLVDARKDEQAVHYLDSATRHYKDLNIIQRFLYYSINYNYYFHIKNDNDRAMVYADSALNLFDTPEKKLKYLPNYDQVFFLKGDVFFNQNKYNEAYQYFYQGKLIANKSISDCTLSDFSYRMGMIMYKQENFRLAAENFKNSTKETANCDLTFGNFYRIQELLNNTGLCFSKINETDSAIFYFKKSLDYIDEHSQKFKDRSKLLDVARGVIYGNEAKIYIQKNNFQLAKKLLKESSAINLRKGNDNRDAELSELKLAHLYYQTGETDSMKNLLSNVRKQLDSVENKDAEADWNFMEAKYFIKKNNSKTALSYFLKYDALKDSIANANKALKDADVARQIKRLEKDYEFNNLKKNIELQNLYLKLGAIFGAMLLIIIFLVLLTWQKSKKNIRILGTLNHQINDQNNNLEQALAGLKLSSEEKDRILQTVAHDLRNPIGGIVSLTLAMADDDYSNEQKEMLNLIQETSHNSLELINEILETTNNVQAVLKKEWVEINSLLSHNAELLRFKAAEKDQQITLELLEAPAELLISREKIWRVISNLISNAIKFSPAGSAIHVKIIRNGNEVEISVKDNGIGIPENMKLKVFNMFSEAKRLGTAATLYTYLLRD
jgi:signal transduction histidine kinase